MPDTSNKPKKIKDLKARLGRGAAGGASADGAPVPAAGPTGTEGGRVPTPVPPIGPGASVAPRPFSSQGGRSMPPQQEMRIVVDEASIQEADAAHGSRTKLLVIAIAIGAVVGIGVGWGIGSGASDRSQFNLAVNDGKEIYESVREATDTVNKAQTLIDKVLQAATGANGKPSIDLKSIEELNQLKKPFTANEFYNRRYLAFPTGVPDQLFDYYNNVNRMWDKIPSLARSVMGDKKQEAIKEAAGKAPTMAATACVPVRSGEDLRCNLVYVMKVEGDKAFVSASVRSPNIVEKQVYSGGDLPEKSSDVVILVNAGKSQGVVSQELSAYSQYLADVMELKSITAKTIEVQGQLEKGLSEVAALAN